MMDGNPARIADAEPEIVEPADPVHAVGVGPGNEEFLTERAVRVLERADVVAGFETVTRRITDVTDADTLACSYDDQTEVLSRFGDRVVDGETGVAVLWGDPNISGYQFLGRVETAVEPPVRVVPGISSVQIAASRSRTPLERSTFASLHRRGDVVDDIDRLSDAVSAGRHLIVIVRPYDWMPPEIARGLVERGADPTLTALVLQDLTLSEERIERTTLGELAGVEEPNERSYSDRTILTVRTDHDE
ncbi:precorrin-6y C5,15-methyltransferase (decarboxylating) subunit CbiE [Halobacteriales archaeon QH_10_65_19]|nr:MAG: precorrin-6y C5,15-methyltransferase (decarboxylating) subunit CbiE [Halobacteriales archaeon QH_10_65_19]